ncbi:E3 ubiquitin-protein ligase Topors-like isoform X2 [Thalassophryne amazonica]|uniref:E3 ubiquitin-protein ligase Topors-like isoform X2 n=1 Tax=Thalassophryne amazonica TaxID=390379 RepID=UPI0014725E14|nr:E3 ubiquitin-protein ligase Topors-like isoform X2 [Thalassophryne amazonica]
MAPTRMKLRIRRHGGVAGEAGGGEGGPGGGSQPEEGERSRESRSRSRKKKPSNASTAASSSAATNSTQPPLAVEEASPDSKCPICLDRFNNLAYLDRCLHRFCFPCIQEWSHNKPECPLCKQPFTSILHSVRAEDDFKEYTLHPSPNNGSVAATVAMVAAMVSAARSDHQIRRMLRRAAGVGATTTTARQQSGERGARGGTGRRVGRDRYPESALHHQDASPEESEEGEEDHSVLSGARVDEPGVIFEGLTGLSGTVDPTPLNDHSTQRLLSTLVMRQRLRQIGAPLRRLRDRETLALRRALYRSSIRVRGIAGVSGNGNQAQQEQRDVTAEAFRHNPASLNRLRPWLRRELTVLYGSHGSLVDIVQRVIMVCLARHGLEDRHAITRPLRPYLLACTDHFLHELVSFARSPLTLEDYDLQAMYKPPTPDLEHDEMISSNDGDSVIAISEDEEEGQQGGRPEEAHGAARANNIQAERSLSNAAWDDETPGPSYSTIEPSCMLAPLSLSSVTLEEEQRREGEEEEVEECLIVGYKKPIAERTPELVQLSSNTEGEEDEKKEESTASVVAPPLSYPPTVPPSTSVKHRDDSYREEENGTAPHRHLRACSWSASSGVSESGHISVCTLSPASPRDSEHQCGKECVTCVRHPEAEMVSEKRRRKKRKRGQNRERVGVLHNPNRCIYPAMMRRSEFSHSSSPFNSSIESCSPLPPSPPDSTWEYRSPHMSPPSSSCYSPSQSSSSSPLWSSPRQQKPPTPSLSPSDCSNSHHGEKPSGKRKYKSRHLNIDEKDPTWRPCGKRDKRKEGGGERKTRARRKERRRKETVRGSVSGGVDRRCRDERSPSVEIIYEGTVIVATPRPPAPKRRRKHHHRRTPRSSSPLVITLNSDSSREDVHVCSSSPLSSQQTVDFSDLPPLPLVPSAGVSGALDRAVGELPVDILDRGREPADLLTVEDSGSSEREVDVENVEGCDHLQERDAVTRGLIKKVTEGHSTASRDQETRDSEVMNTDSRLLAAILSDLEGIIAPKCDLPLTFDPSCSPESRTCFRSQCDVGWNRPQQDDGAAGEDRVPRDHVGTYGRCSDLAPPLQHGSDVPPLLKQASPHSPHNRNTPPPLKHKDAESPRLSPPTDTADSVTPPTDGASHATMSLLDSHLTANRAVPTASVSSKSTAQSSSGAVTEFEGRATSSDTTVDSSSVASCLPHLHFASFPSLHSISNNVLTDTSAAPPTDSGAPLFSIGSHSAGCPSNTDSTCRGSRELTSCRVVPADLLPDIPSNGSPPVFVSSISSAIPSPASPGHSHFPTDNLSKRCLPASRSSIQTASFRSTLMPVDLHHQTTKSIIGVREKPPRSSLQSQTASGPPTLGAVTPARLPERSPTCHVDLNCWSVASASRELWGRGEMLSVVGSESRPPLNHLPHIDSQCVHPPQSVVGFDHLNHTALPSSSSPHASSGFESCSKPHIDAHPKILTDSGVHVRSQRDMRLDGQVTSLSFPGLGSQRSGDSSDPGPQTDG